MDEVYQTKCCSNEWSNHSFLFDASKSIHQLTLCSCKSPNRWWRILEPIITNIKKYKVKSCYVSISLTICIQYPLSFFQRLSISFVIWVNQDFTISMLFTLINLTFYNQRKLKKNKTKKLNRIQYICHDICLWEM